MTNETPLVIARMEHWAERLASFFAIVGGLLLLVACILTVLSIFGSIVLRPLPGEIELVEALCGLAVFAFLPFCQLKRGHVGVDIVISAFGRGAMNWSQLIGDILIAFLFGLITWRHAIGTMDKFENGEITPLLLLPVWWGFAAALVLLIVNLIVSVFVVFADANAIRQKKTIVSSMGAH